MQQSFHSSPVAPPGRLFRAQDIRWVWFARQSIVDGSVEPMGHELSFCWGAEASREGLIPSPIGVSMALAHALLDGGLMQRTQGRVFVTLDAAALHSPVADALCAPSFVIQLPATLGVEEVHTRRIAQLHARGYRFALADLVSGEDARWAWAPLASYAKLRVAGTPAGAWAGLLARARWADSQVIADGLESPADYLRLLRLGVPYFQGSLVLATQEERIRALPCCDAQVLARLGRLVEQGAARETLAMVAATDPALVIRLLMLQRLYGGADHAEAATLSDVMEALPYRVLGGWFRILRASSFDPHERGRAWSACVREQMYNYRARLIGARACRTPSELESRVFDLYRRLCSRDALAWLATEPEEGLPTS